MLRILHIYDQGDCGSSLLGLLLVTVLPLSGGSTLGAALELQTHCYAVP